MWIKEMWLENMTHSNRNEIQLIDVQSWKEWSRWLVVGECGRKDSAAQRDLR